MLKIPLSQMVEEAIGYAVVYHKGQTDKSDQPMILHILRVGLNSGPDPVQQTVGFLHDIVEDTNLTLHDLILDGFPVEVVAAVDALTRRTTEKPNGGQAETYWEYLERLKKNLIALKVKQIDLKDNLDPSRQAFPGAKLLADKHTKALSIVQDALEALRPTEDLDAA